MMSGLILKKCLSPVCSFAITPPVHSNNFKIQNPPVVQAFLGFTSWQQVLCMTPSPNQSPKENKLKLWPKYMYYNVQCTNVGMYVSEFLQNLF
jgi:hypothetical protein